MLRFFRRHGRESQRDEVEEYGASVAGPLAPERPPLPRPERINRSALTIVAVIMGTLVIATVVFVQPNRRSEADGRAQPATPPVLPQGTFLDQPLRQPPPPNDVPLTPTFPLTDSLGPRGAAGAVPRAPTDLWANSQPLGSPLSESDARQRAFEAALVAPVFASETKRDRGSSALLPDWESGPTGLEGDATPARGSVSAQRSESTSRVADRMRRSNDRPMLGTSAVRVSVEPAPGPYAIQAGTLIPAVLLTGIDSDLPGEVLAQVARDVYDTRSMQALVVPKGSKLIGKYEDQVAVGQNRLLVAWTRVIFPDGRSVSLNGLETKDRSGAGGLQDRVDNHTRQVFGTAALLSVVSAGVQLSQQPRGTGGPYGAYPTPQQVGAAAVGQELAEVATQMLRRNIDIRPTIRIRQGLPFNIFLNTDLSFAEPYVAQR
jgi:type IV secretion system protein TrbI